MLLLIGYGKFISPRRTEKNKEAEKVIFGNRTLNKQVSSEGSRIWKRYWSALVIEATEYEAKSKFKRIGIAQGLDCTYCGWFDGCTREELILI